MKNQSQRKRFWGTSATSGVICPQMGIIPHLSTNYPRGPRGPPEVPEVVFETGRQNMNTDKYLSMTDAYLKKTSKGEIPEKITRDLRFCMDEQQDRLQKKDSR